MIAFDRAVGRAMEEVRLNGNQDIANPVDNWYALGARARSAEIHVFPDAAHGSSHQFPERTAEEVESFIRAHGG